MPKGDRLLPHRLSLRVLTWTLAILDDQPAELLPPRLCVPICMWHFHRPNKERSPHVGGPMPAHRARFPASLHAISLGYMHSMLSLDRAYMMDELEGLIVF